MPRSTLTTDSAPSVPARDGFREGLALSDVFGLLRRSWLWIVLPTLLAACAAAAFVHTVPPRYTGEAKVLLESRDPSFARTAAERTDQVQPIDEQAVASQVQVVMSRDLAREAVRRLKLVGNPEFDPSVGEIGPVQRVLMMIGLARNPLERPSEDRVLEAYFDRLLVFPAGKSRILTIEFRARDAELAARAANTIAELYIASLEAAKVDTARYASTWLGGNVEGLRARVADAEGKVEAFRAKHGLIGTGGSANQPLSAQQLGELSSQLSQARTIQADLTARVRLLKEMIKEGRAFEIPDVANNELIRRTVESRMSMRAQLALESRTLLSAHPRIKELTAQLNDLEIQIKAAAERIVRTLENDARIAGARVESLQATVDGQRDVVVRGNGNEIQLRALEREAKVQREQLESYLARYREATARDAESATPADARIVSRAVVPETPSFPKKVPIVAFSAVLAFLLSAGLVVARHLLVTGVGADRSDAPERAEPRARREPPMRADPERLTHPEPLPPTGRRTAPALAAFRNAYTASARSQRPSAPVASVAPAVAADPVAPPAAAQGAEPDLDLANLIARLEAGPRAGAGRCVLVAEATETTRAGRGDEGMLARALSEALAGRARTVTVDLGAAQDAVGLTDLVAGEAAFLDVIQPVPGSRRHAVARGRAELAVLTEDTEALAVGFGVLGEAYDWVVCRCMVEDGEAAEELYAGLSACADAVVIVSDAAADDSALVALYALAEEAGAGQVLVAQGAVRPAGSLDERAFEDMPLRLSA